MIFTRATARLSTATPAFWCRRHAAKAAAGSGCCRAPLFAKRSAAAFMRYASGGATPALKAAPSLTCAGTYLMSRGGPFAARLPEPHPQVLVRAPLEAALAGSEPLHDVEAIGEDDEVGVDALDRHQRREELGARNGLPLAA